jgi:hypothetical protein
LPKFRIQNLENLVDKLDMDDKEDFDADRSIQNKQ